MLCAYSADIYNFTIIIYIKKVLLHELKCLS